MTIVFLLFVILAGVTYLKIWATKFDKEYPKKFECPQFNDQFTIDGEIN